MLFFRKFVLFFVAWALLISSLPVVAAADVELKVYDPRASIWSPAETLLQVRPSTLDGKKIAFLNNTKPSVDNIRPFVEMVLKENFQGVEFKEFIISYNDYPKKADDLKALAAWADGVIGLIGD